MLKKTGEEQQRIVTKRKKANKERKRKECNESVSPLKRVTFVCCGCHLCAEVDVTSVPKCLCVCKE